MNHRFPTDTLYNSRPETSWVSDSLRRNGRLSFGSQNSATGNHGITERRPAKRQKVLSLSDPLQEDSHSTSPLYVRQSDSAPCLPNPTSTSCNEKTRKALGGQKTQRRKNTRSSGSSHSPASATILLRENMTTRSQPRLELDDSAVSIEDFGDNLRPDKEKRYLESPSKQFDSASDDVQEIRLPKRGEPAITASPKRKTEISFETPSPAAPERSTKRKALNGTAPTFDIDVCEGGPPNLLRESDDSLDELQFGHQHSKPTSSSKQHVQRPYRNREIEDNKTEIRTNNMSEQKMPTHEIAVRVHENLQKFEHSRKRKGLPTKSGLDDQPDASTNSRNTKTASMLKPVLRDETPETTSDIPSTRFTSSSGKFLRRKSRPRFHMLEVVVEGQSFDAAEVEIDASGDHAIIILGANHTAAMNFKSVRQAHFSENGVWLRLCFVREEGKTSKDVYLKFENPKARGQFTDRLFESSDGAAIKQITETDDERLIQILTREKQERNDKHAQGDEKVLQCWPSNHQETLSREGPKPGDVSEELRDFNKRRQVRVIDRMQSIKPVEVDKANISSGGGKNKEEIVDEDPEDDVEKEGLEAVPLASSRQVERSTVVSPRKPGERSRSGLRSQGKHEVQASAVDETTNSSKNTKLPPTWAKPLTFPAGRGPGRVTVDYRDLTRLFRENEFLNDNLVSFGLRFAQEKDQKSRSSVYIFNTFFYEALTRETKTKKGINYDAVKRWTSKIDLFKYNYIVVPVNESYHWYAAIICNLQALVNGIDGQEHHQTDDDVAKGLTPNAPPFSAHAIDELATMSAENVLINDKLPKTIDLAQSEHESLPLDDNANFQSASDRSKPPLNRKGRKPNSPTLNRNQIDPEKPLIVVLDSFAGKHSRMVRNLKDYILQEAMVKRGITVEEPRGIYAQGIPLQKNYSDCGLYLMQYIEKFLEDPDAFVRKVVSRDMNIDKHWSNFSPASLRKHYRTLLLEEYKRQEPDYEYWSSDRENSPLGQETINLGDSPRANQRPPPEREMKARSGSMGSRLLDQTPQDGTMVLTAPKPISIEDEDSFHLASEHPEKISGQIEKALSRTNSSSPTVKEGLMVPNTTYKSTINIRDSQEPQEALQHSTARLSAPILIDESQETDEPFAVARLPGMQDLSSLQPRADLTGEVIPSSVTSSQEHVSESSTDEDDDMLVLEDSQPSYKPDRASPEPQPSNSLHFSSKLPPNPFEPNNYFSVSQQWKTKGGQISMASHNGETRRSTIETSNSSSTDKNTATTRDGNEDIDMPDA